MAVPKTSIPSYIRESFLSRTKLGFITVILAQTCIKPT
jgi:hypothetical protein